MAQFVQYKKMTKQTYKSIKCDFGGSKMPFTKYNVKMKKKKKKSAPSMLMGLQCYSACQKRQITLCYLGNDRHNNQLDMHELARGDSWTLNTLNVVIQQSTRHTALN